ncbi:extracellular solute-binding protein [Streptomyces albipurpureus]|uniref:Extracellular solute-binding protein n=1 Tax=Streptomyces albipurpureus TaxID=2897419 RepID=A0ABT0UPK9_9ACTN|nr:extracellular solute-binding protein [Streptomyces sp. CWNU-1]MCM2389530.1 extracellular solute-binding protein [Streptomyces sp. CWNU-1]
MKIRPLQPSVALVCAAALTGCGLIPGTGSDTRTVQVWLMKDSVTEEFLDRFTKEYKKDHPSVKLKFTFQGWNGIGEKVNAALKGKDTPDVIEVGNTQVPQYAESNALTDLTLESVRDLGSEDWLEGLAQPGNINGSQYGIPWYAANRVVIYNKNIFADAGIKDVPKTRTAWLKLSEKLNSNGNQGIYLSGQDWYTLAGFIWEDGGNLAMEKGGSWEGTLDTAEAKRGMNFYKKLQSHGKGPMNADERTPPQEGVFASGKVAQIISTPSAAAVIEKANPQLKGKLGYFSIPGITAKKPGAVFTGGSDLIIPERSKQRSAAIDVVSALASERWQKDLARTMNYVPNKKSLATVDANGHESAAAMAAGARAEGSKATPNSAQWADVEAKNPIKAYMTAVLQGEDHQKAAKDASDKITALLTPR